MCATYVVSMFYVLLVAVAVMGAPLAEKEADVKKRSVNPANEVRDQEKDLQNLLNIVNKESQHDDVMVHSEQVSHLENEDGKTVEVQQKEEKVVDTNTGNVIADVKQEVKQESAGSDAKPETVVETKVDIPSEGVHETFVTDGEEGNTEEGADNPEEVEDVEPELTPADMAEYLYVTQQFDAFYNALESLVNQSKMSAEDAEAYAKTVALEYERLQLEDFEQNLIEEEKRQAANDMSYNQMLSMNYGQAEPGYDQYANPSYDVSGFPSAYYKPYNGYYEQQPEMQGYDAEVDPYDFLAALWDEAYGKGNEEAQEIVKMLYDRVSQDDNPDDMGQIRDILLETVAASLNPEDQYNFDMESMPSAYQKQEMKEEAEPVMPVGVSAPQQIPSEPEKKDADDKEKKEDTKEEVKEVKADNVENEADKKSQ